MTVRTMLVRGLALLSDSEEETRREELRRLRGVTDQLYDLRASSQNTTQDQRPLKLMVGAVKHTPHLESAQTSGNDNRRTKQEFKKSVEILSGPISRDRRYYLSDTPV